MILPGETEAGTAGTQPCRGIARWAHRDDARGVRTRSQPPTPKKIPQRFAAGSLLLQVAEECLSFFQQWCLSVTIQEKGMFEKLFQHWCGPPCPRLMLDDGSDNNAYSVCSEPDCRDLAERWRE